MNDAGGARRAVRVLDPMDRISEVLFGLIMVLTFTGSLSAASAARDEVRTMLIGAIGCNLAWGLVDAAMYLMARFAERGRDLLTYRSVRAATDETAARRGIADALPPVVASVLNDAELSAIRAAPAIATRAARAREADPRRLRRRARRVPARLPVDVPGRDPVPLHERPTAGDARVQRGRPGDALPHRGVARAPRRQPAAGERTRHGGRRPAAGRADDRARRVSAARRRQPCCWRRPVNQNATREGEQQRDAERRAERPVARVALELVLDDVADHVDLAAAEDVVDGVEAERRDEDQQHAGGDARRGHRHDHARERAHRSGAEVERRLDQRVVELLDAGVDRQDHERQEGVDEAEDDGARRVEHLERLQRSAAYCSSRPFSRPSLFRIVTHA